MSHWESNLVLMIPINVCHDVVSVDLHASGEYQIYYPVRCAQGRVKRLSPSIYICVSQKTGLFAVLLLENRHEIALYRSAS